MNPYKALVLSLWLLWIMPLCALAQNSTTVPMEDVLEQLSMASDEGDINWSNEIEELTERLQEPINLNTVTKEQLEQFPFLTDIQIENILAYVYINGPMQTIYELQMVEEMDYHTIRYLMPFVVAEPVASRVNIPNLWNVLRYGKNELLTRLDVPFYKRRAYTETEKIENRYWGTPQYHSLRYNFRYKDQIYAGITAEKDAGEPFFGLHNKKGYDYYSFYFYLRNIGKLKALVVGNYRISFGQGLVVSHDFMMGKTTSFGTMSTRNNTIRKHSSTDEYNYFRGIAGAWQLGDFVLSGFYSHRHLDGIIFDDTITSIQKNGLHRTTREAEKRNVITLQAAGGNITYSHDKFKVGLTGMYYFFNRPYYANTLSRKYGKYNLRGTDFYNLGVDYRFRLHRFTFTGEVAVDRNNSLASVNSVSYTTASQYQFMLLHRYYAHDYWSFFGRSFSEGGQVQNENGWYLATEITPLAHWKLFASIDLFSFPWWKYRVDSPSQGGDGTIQLTYTPRRNLNMYLRYRYKKKDRNYTDADDIKSTRPLNHHRFRYQLNYTVTDNLSLRTTLDFNSIHSQNTDPSRGYQAVQTVSYRFLSLPLSVHIHGSYFHTDDYDSRVYASEKGLLYTFYVPSFYGQGSRFMAHIRWDISRNLMVIGKIGTTRYSDREQIGSGWDVIDGSTKRIYNCNCGLNFKKVLSSHKI